MNRRSVVTLCVTLLLLTSGTVGATAGVGAVGASFDDTSTTDISGTAPAEPFPQTTTLVRGSPDLSVALAQPEVTPGRTNQVTLQLINDGDISIGTPQNREVVTTARNVRLTAEADDSPLKVETGTLALGAVSENRPRDVPLAVSVPNGTEAGNYELEIDVEYSYTSQLSGGVSYDEEETTTLDVDVEVTDDARFKIVDVATDAQIGDRGTLEATLKNIGATAAHDATVALESSSAGLALGQRASDAARVGSISPGETVTIPYDASFTPTAPARQYAISGQVSFDTPDGIPHVDQGLSAGVTPLGEQTFALEDV